MLPSDEELGFSVSYDTEYEVPKERTRSISTRLPIFNLLLLPYRQKSIYCVRPIIIERRGRVVSTPASQSGRPVSNIGPDTGFPDCFPTFSQYLRENTRIVL
jgi:hypothetical protein